MNKIAIITDTDSSLPTGVTKKHHITQVPIIVQFGEESFRAVYDIDDVDTFERIDQSGKLPTTAAPSPGQFVEAYKAAFEEGAETILCFTVSSEVSATFSAACSAASMLPGKDITVVDTRSLTMGQGLMILAAAEAISRGASKQEAVAVAEDLRGRTHLFAALATLKYLAMSGRVGYLTAGIADALNVKPIVTIRDGKLDLLERVRTQKKAWERVIELIAAEVGTRKIERMSIVHVSAAEAALRFENQLRAALDCPDEILYAELTPGLSVHSGAGLVGAAFVTHK